MSSTVGVHHEQLGAAAGSWGKLGPDAVALAQRVAEALTGMATAAGHSGFAVALGRVNQLNAQRLTELDALYQHIQDSLAATATEYATSDGNAAQRVSAAGRPPS
ncbi:hypothetical protein [Actinoplanes sp. NPDC051411]|uniref:hypothetical protein n=1 Tax=Actinoplanes sp. NPDC051411 TaxID=3155522 RepID=UPI0034172FEB